MASDAEKNCPVSKALNAAITLDAKLIPIATAIRVGNS
jgi:organic hydroperoxide reductase OsmC/OhrA